MSQKRFKQDLLLGLLSLAQRNAPVKLEALLRRMGFRDGDITFRRTATGKYWTEINRWPWESNSIGDARRAAADEDPAEAWQKWFDANGVADDEDAATNEATPRRER